MNSKNILLAATLAGGLLSSSVVASASVVLDSAALTESSACSAPAPVKVVKPTGISRRHEGEVVHVGLTIDETGRPHNVRLLSDRDANLVKNLLPAVAQWKFTPAKKAGQAVAMDVVLPIQLVDISAF